jgi:hypothetical protein
MSKTLKSRKLLVLLLTLAMIVSLCAGMTIGASATYTPTGTMTSLWNSGNPTSASSNTYYSISSAAEMGYFRDYVNTINMNTNGVTFYLTDNIALSGTWTPIGGASAENSSYAPNGIYFGGMFDGQGHAITGLSVSTTVSTSTKAGWGLFGCVSGTVKGLSVSGSVSVSGTGEYIGGIVGYCTGNVKNCTSNVTITATGSTAVGGIVGAVETSSSTGMYPRYVYRCSATGSVNGLKRIGGIAGATYCTTAGGIVIDECCYTTGTIRTYNTARKAYVGGIVGYCRGYVANCYINNATLQGYNGTGSYLGGIAGLMQGSGPQAGMYNCYANATFASANNTYDHALVATVDNSTTLPIWNCFWVVTGTITQGSGAGWGAWTNSMVITTAQLNGSSAITASYGTGSILDFLNDIITTTTGNTSTAAWSQTIGTAPVLSLAGTGYGTGGAGSLIAVPDVYGSGAVVVPSTPDGTNVIYLDPVYGSDVNNGTSVNDAAASLSHAITLAAASSPAKAISVLNTIPYTSGTNTLDSSVTIKRSLSFDGYLFSVSGGSLTLTNVTVDGNYSTTNSGFKSSLFNVTGTGSLIVGSNATLTNNKAYSGGAIRIYGSGASATVNSGSITNNIARNGGAIAVYNASDLTLNGGSISGNTATQAGPSIYMQGDLFTLNPASGTVLNSAVYLAEGKYITATAALANITGGFTVNAEKEWSSAKLVVGSGYTLVAADVNAVTYSGTTGWTDGLNYLSNVNAIVMYDGNGIYLMTGNGNGGNGGYYTPYLSSASAFTAAGSTGNVYILDAAVLGGTIAIASPVWRDMNCTSALFNVNSSTADISVSANVNGGYDRGIATAGPLFNVSDGAVTVSAGTLSNNDFADGGAVVLSGGSFDMTGGKITECSATKGGAAYITGGSFTMVNATVTGNSADDGGAFFIDGGSLAANLGNGNTIIGANTATGAGGGICAMGGTVSLAGGGLTENSAKNGGGIFIENAAVTISNNGFVKSNNALVNGGGVYLKSGSLTVTGTDFHDNSAVGLGVGVYKEGGTLTLSPAATGNFTLTDVVYLTNGQYVSLGATTSNLSSQIVLECANPYNGLSVAYSTAAYAIGSSGSDENGFIYLNNAWLITDNFAGTLDLG